ncbi:MAG: pyruvate dehydrogenase (acetyl-transferring), homodimeric type, partial [Deltaproteobacteria bacterium]|nr:pyruvate dehydrogenase (acetyl-transferring), homodimeric type [Deltaproteobacteria bacterium]
YNEMYPMPPMPAGVEDGIRRGLYKLAPATQAGDRPRVHLFGSGAILREAMAAQALLAERGVAAEVWSVTSYSELRRDALACERWNRLHPGAAPRQSYVAQQLAAEPWPIIAATDYLKAVPDQIGRFVPAGLVPLGTDGFGRSDTRDALRRHFEIDAASSAVAALAELARRGALPAEQVAAALAELGVDAEAEDPARL